MTDLTIDGETIAVAVTGDPTRPALMLSHALGTDHRMWDGQIPLLEKHFRLVRYDTRGHGGSPRGTGPISIAQLGRDALNILDALDIDRAHWLGLSMGGAIGLWLLANASQRIDRAVIANSAPRLGTADGWNERILSVHKHGMAKAADATLARWFSPSFAAREPQRLAIIGDMLHAMDPKSYAAACAALRDMDLHAAIGSIPHDVLVIGGRDDPTITPDDANALATALPGGRLVELDARHLSNIEAEADFNAAVVAFLTTKRMPRVKPPGGAGVKKSDLAKSPVPQRGNASRRSNAARNPLKRASPAKPAAGKAASGKAAERPKAARAAPTQGRQPGKVARPKSLASRAKTKRSDAKTRVARKATSARGSAIRSSGAKPSPGRTTVRKAGVTSSVTQPATTRRKAPVVKARGAVKASLSKAPSAKTKASGKSTPPIKAARKTAAAKRAPAARRKSTKKPRRPNGRRKT